MNNNYEKYIKLLTDYKFVKDVKKDDSIRNKKIISVFYNSVFC